MEEEKNESSESNSQPKKYNFYGEEIQKNLDDENENNKDSEIKLKTYDAAEAVISFAKGMFYFIAFMSYVGLLYIGFIIDFNLIFWASLIPISIFLLLAYALIQMIELFFDIGKNTNQTNILIQKLIDKIKE